MLTSPRKSANLSLSADVLADAKTLGINISRECDQFLRERVRKEKALRWQAEHVEFVAAYNRTVEEEGLPLAEWRSF